MVDDRSFKRPETIVLLSIASKSSVNLTLGYEENVYVRVYLARLIQDHHRQVYR